MNARPWICCSSSSGQTFRAMYAALPFEARAGLQGFFTDRACGALEVARELLGPERVHEFPRKEFESRALAWMEQNQFSVAGRDGLILLCGFFGILSADFLARCASAVVNTHPSLLPAFPGKDESVHRKAFEEATVSGFSIHLVNEKLDGGPVLFQHPVFLDITISQEENRARVRAAEQRWLPAVWARALAWPLAADDRHLSTRALREKYGINLRSFRATENLE